MSVINDVEKPIGCVSWRATQQCSPYGTRDPAGDTGCRNFVQFTSGYCECDNSVVVAPVACGMHTFTCFDRCRELGSQGAHLPKLMTCDGPRRRRALLADGLSLAPVDAAQSQVPTSTEGQPVSNSSAGAVAGLQPAATSTSSLESRPLDDSVRMWETLLQPVRAHDPKVGQRLAPRTEDDDWLREGGHMDPGLAQNLRSALHSYTAALAQDGGPAGSAQPPVTQRGRGIVMVSGGLRFMVSAWIGLAMLRRTGSTLPVEMWFPVLEYPTLSVVESLRSQGVTCRTFSVPDLDQAGYSLKIAAILLSSFEEVLFLDADNFPLRDPEVLFEDPEYKRAGCMFWRDYWAPTAVPDLATILDVPARDLPDSTFEAGQMVIRKRRHWRGLRVALYFNYYREVFYSLFTDYMGWGDKETFFYAFMAAREPTFYVPNPTGSIGIMRPFCRRYKTRMLCRETFTGNSMIQYGLDDQPLFLHSNLNKWTLQLPDSFSDYTRRWRTMEPGGQDFPAWSERFLGLDLERFAYDQARAFRCAPFFEEYLEVRIRHGDSPLQPLGGLHPLAPGIEFHQLYRLGHRGTYYDLFERSRLDDFLYYMGVASRTVMMYVKRVLRRFWGGRLAVRFLFEAERRLRNRLLSYAT